MRTGLKKYPTKRGRFEGKVSAIVASPKKIALDTVVDADGVVADHAWLALDSRLEALAPKRGDVVAFDATVKRYVKTGEFGEPDALDFGFADVREFKVYRKG